MLGAARKATDSAKEGVRAKAEDLKAAAQAKVDAIVAAPAELAGKAQALTLAGKGANPDGVAVDGLR